MGAPVDPALSAPGEYETVLAQERLDAWIEKLRAADEFAFDTETDSLDPMRANLVGIGFSVEPGRACYSRSRTTIPARRRSCRARRRWTRCARCSRIRQKKLGQHGKYDLHVLRRHGVDVAGYADDTMLESFVLEAGPVATTWIRWPSATSATQR